MKELHYDHERRRDYLLTKLRTNHKLCETVHLIIDAIHTVDDGIITILPERGPIVIVDNRSSTRVMMEAEEKRLKDKG